MKILFVCKYNRFRSKVAEAIFNSLNKNKEIKAESAGMTVDVIRPYIEPMVLDIVNKKGYAMKDSRSRQLTRELIEKGNFDLIIISANNVEPEFFYKIDKKIKVIQWPVKDCSSLDEECIINSVNEIESNVKKLVKELKS